MNDLRTRFPVLELLQDCCDPPLTPESLADLQRRLGVRFPREYADGLLAGRFVQRVSLDARA